jgi:hypothetical protein
MQPEFGATIAVAFMVAQSGPCLLKMTIRNVRPPDGAIQTHVDYLPLETQVGCRFLENPCWVLLA